MPLSKEARARYPKDWRAISIAAMRRAEWRCQHEGCTARQFSIGRWLVQGVRKDWLQMHAPAASYWRARQVAAELQDQHQDDKIIVIVLTTAHLNHDPADCSPENLRPMCQRHHLAYDQAHHITNAQATRRAKLGNLELPL